MGSSLIAVSEKTLLIRTPEKPNLASQHGASKENISYCEISHGLMRAGEAKEQTTTRQRSQPPDGGGCLIPACWSITPKPAKMRGGENPLAENRRKKMSFFQPLSSCFPFQMLPTKPGDASSCARPCRAKRGWERSKGMKRVGDGAGREPPATLKC